MTGKEYNQLEEHYGKLLSEIQLKHQSGEISGDECFRLEEQCQERRKKAVKPYWDAKDKRKSNSNNSSSSSEGCFIATACYGSYDSNEVLIFRNFRDDFLFRYKSGRYFIKKYYKYSPVIASKIKNRYFINIIKMVLLNPIYVVLKKMNF